MAGCLTCRQRKVKCDGRPNLCRRCEKLNLECLVQGSPPSSQGTNSALTQAGHKRLRIPVACEGCRRRKLKCDALKPACSPCVRKKVPCQYMRRPHELQTSSASRAARSTREISNRVSAAASIDALTSPRDDSLEDRRPNVTWRASPSAVERLNTTPRWLDEMSAENGQSPRLRASESQSTPLPVASGQELLPYIDSLLENVHPISCNNFLHPGCLCEGLDQAPTLLLLAICGSASKFMPGSHSQRNGQKWADKAKSLIMKSLDHVSTLTISAIQFLALHDMHQGEYTSAWNLVGIASRMSLQLRLYELDSRGTFLQQECQRRLMWAVFVSDLLFECDKNQIDPDLLIDLPLPCNLWSFTQGLPCKTLTLRQLRGKVEDVTIKQSSNHCAYLINILVIRRKILNYLNHIHDFDMDLPWLESSHFSALWNELEIWRSNLPANYAFVERYMYTFRVSRHLDIFLMIHAYYHQCCILLFDAFIPESANCVVARFATPVPPAFIQHCAEQCFSHSRSVALLIQKVFKVEPEHLFRDPWFGLCIWDSTCALLTESRRQHGNIPLEEDIAEHLKLNLRAVTNTKLIMPLAEKIYGCSCAAIRKHGLAGLVGLNMEETERTALEPDTLDLTDGISRRYPFLSPMRARESPAWQQLFLPVNVGGSVDVTRDSSPWPSHQPSSHPKEGPSTVDLGQNLPNMDQFPSMDDTQMQLLYSWPIQDPQLWQVQHTDLDPAAAAAITGMMPPLRTSQPLLQQEGPDTQMSFPSGDLLMTPPMLAANETSQTHYMQ